MNKSFDRKTAFRFAPPPCWNKLAISIAAVFLLSLTGLFNFALPTAQAAGPYTITHDGTNFEVTGGGAISPNSSIQTVINNIRADASGQPCIIQFGSGGGNVLDLGSSFLEFINASGGTWGDITLTGAVTSSSAATIRLGNNSGGVTVTCSADITTTNTGSSTALRVGFGSTLNLTGGTLDATAGTLGTALNIQEGSTANIGSGVTLKASDMGIRVNDSTLNISGGTVDVGTDKITIMSNVNSSVNIKASFTSGSRLDNAGTLNIDPGVTLTCNGTFRNSGAINNNGTIVNNVEIINTGDGAISGSGTISGDGTVTYPPPPEQPEPEPEPDQSNGNGGGNDAYIPPDMTPFYGVEPTPDSKPDPKPEKKDTPSDWAAAAVEKALELKLIPANLQDKWQSDLSRADFCALAVKLYEYLDGKPITARGYFDDTTDINVQKLAGLGIVTGDGSGKFNPDGAFTREMALTLMYNMMVQLGHTFEPAEPSFADADSISPWAKAAIGALQKAGVVSGDGQYFNPSLIFTREMGAVTLMNFMERLT